MLNKRKIPYGVINWAEIVRECLFVDNTRYIRELEAIKTPVFLRPKRFGKSVVCSMLAHYYDVDLKDRFDELFGMTDIGRDPTPLRNSFLVLTFDFSTVQVGTLAEIEKRFWQNIKGAVGYLTVKYKDLALQDTVRLENCLQYLAEIYKLQSDKQSYEQTLVDGFEHYPNSSYFFPRLIDHYSSTNQRERAMTIVDEALAANDSSELFIFAKSKMLLNQGDYDACIALCDTLIARNDTLADAYYNAGVAYVNKAFLIEKGKVGAKQRKQMREFYRKALPYMERYRALAPHEKDKWAAALYNIYLKLNMGREFEEIDRMLR